VTVEITELGTRADEWDAFVRASDAGTPFHLIAWKRAVEETFGHRPHYLMATRGGSIEGVLPLFETRGLLGGRALISVPYAVYGGICASSPPASRALVDAATALAGARNAKYVELRQRHDLGLGLSTKSLYVAFARAIAASDEDNAQAIPRKQRRMTRQGAKFGLQATIGRAHLDAVYDVYARSVRKLGSPVFPRRLFHAIYDAFDKDCQVVAVWHDGRVVAGVVTLFYEDQVLPYYGGARPEALAYAVNDFMYWELMCHAARAGFRVFDFGRSREGTGSYHFKRHWGFEPVPLPYQYVLGPGQAVPNVSPSNPRFKLATNIWQRLPLRVTNALGPALTRYLP
jgi:FemAB-related protein (PEP-CTERM system-associated)